MYERLAALAGVLPGVQFFGYDGGTREVTDAPVAYKITCPEIRVDRTRPQSGHHHSVYAGVGVPKTGIILDCAGEETTKEYHEEWVLKRPQAVEVIYDIFAWCHDAITAFKLQQRLLEQFPDRGVLKFPFDKAFATITYTTPVNGATVTVDGTTFTKVAAAPTGNQFTTIAELTTLINALINVNATFVDDIITVEAVEPGDEGNEIELASSDSVNLELSSATLLSGAHYEFPIEQMQIQSLDDLSVNVRETMFRFKLEAYITGYISDDSRKSIKEMDLSVYRGGIEEAENDTGELLLELII